MPLSVVKFLLFMATAVVARIVLPECPAHVFNQWTKLHEGPDSMECDRVYLEDYEDLARICVTPACLREMRAEYAFFPAHCRITLNKSYHLSKAALKRRAKEMCGWDL